MRKAGQAMAVVPFIAIDGRGRLVSTRFCAMVRMLRRRSNPRSPY